MWDNRKLGKAIKFGNRFLITRRMWKWETPAFVLEKTWVEEDCLFLVPIVVCDISTRLMSYCSLCLGVNVTIRWSIW